MMRILMQVVLLLVGMGGLFAENVNPPCEKTCEGIIAVTLTPPSPEEICVSEDPYTPPTAAVSSTDPVTLKGDGTEDCPNETITGPNLNIAPSEHDVDITKAGEYTLVYTYTPSGKCMKPTTEIRKTTKVTVIDVDITSKSKMEGKDIIVTAGYEMTAAGKPDPNKHPYSWSSDVAASFKPNRMKKAKVTKFKTGSSPKQDAYCKVTFDCAEDEFNFNLVAPDSATANKKKESNSFVVELGNYSKAPSHLINSTVKYTVYDNNGKLIPDPGVDVRGEKDVRFVEVNPREIVNWEGPKKIVAMLKRHVQTKSVYYKGLHRNTFTDGLNIPFNHPSYMPTWLDALQSSHWDSLDTGTLVKLTHPWIVGVKKSDDRQTKNADYEKRVAYNKFTVTGTVTERTESGKPKKIRIDVEYIINVEMSGGGESE